MSLFKMLVMNMVFALGLSGAALAADRTVYDKPDVLPGKIIKGKVVHVDQASPQSWNVTVKDRESGEAIMLHIDKDTNRRSGMAPDLGDNVIAKYVESNHHALSFLTDESISH